jgi:hypothetical protein
MARRGIGIFYFALTPGSVDTGGLLKDDYTKPEQEKLDLLAKMPSTDVRQVVAAGSKLNHVQLVPSPQCVPTGAFSPRGGSGAVRRGVSLKCDHD